MGRVLCDRKGCNNSLRGLSWAVLTRRGTRMTLWHVLPPQRNTTIPIRSLQVQWQICICRKISTLYQYNTQPCCLHTPQQHHHTNSPTSHNNTATTITPQQPASQLDKQRTAAPPSFPCATALPACMPPPAPAGGAITAQGPSQRRSPAPRKPALLWRSRPARGLSIMDLGLAQVHVSAHRLLHALEAVPLEALCQLALDVGHHHGAIIRQGRVDLHK